MKIVTKKNLKKQPFRKVFKGINSNFGAFILAGIISLSGITVMLGWIFDVPALKSILPIWVSMKFITAVAFLISGVILLLLNVQNKGDVSKIVILVLSFALLLLMVTFFVSLFTGISTGIENLFVKEAAGTVRTTVPGVPAVPTIFCFILIALSGVFYSWKDEPQKYYLFLGIITLLLGALAVMGYIFGVPYLYYNFPGYTAMAIHTAILFVVCGLTLILRGINSNNSLPEENKK
jgi:methyl-accepting chemotaxis protein